MKSIVVHKMKKLVEKLEDNYEVMRDLCGKDDEINTLPAKEMYESAKDILAHLEQSL